MKKKFNIAKADKKTRRELHFANGGTLATWRGRATTFKDRKKEQSKKFCRKHNKREY